MSIGFRKIFRDLWRSKGRTALAVLSIFIGVFAMGMVGGVSDLLPARMMAAIPRRILRTSISTSAARSATTILPRCHAWPV